MKLTVKVKPGGYLTVSLLSERTVGNTSTPYHCTPTEEREDEEMKSYWSRTCLSVMFILLL